MMWLGLRLGGLYTHLRWRKLTKAIRARTAA